jgi:hypothetical protein
MRDPSSTRDKWVERPAEKTASEALKGFVRGFRKETIMTATKAIAGGVAANIVTIILWAISTIPGWHAVPDEPKAAIIALVSSCIGAALVYFAPANKQTLTETAPEGPDSLEAYGSGVLVR